ncbi:LPXTG cell wall anchor domain-containing protein [Fructilactobacillus cliffordii]|uniref:LPXTG cell wall anchor domain-containing protein n=1 Tax=Fructilactobacillus cliffordii TaxID=2940299 RepID=A0A9Q8ZVH1_9LACO|nr:LPXTG cell wall anchor domain-containing protein [Fructilactobacillus cliffordii]USS90002.1 LPXTG cell wall anchor domain-containing protein [Fructilactobacillus cliffordii]
MKVNGQYNPNLNLYRFTANESQKNKLYKKGKNWVVATTTVITFAGMVGTVNSVNADTNSSVTAPNVTATATQATQATQPATNQSNDSQDTKNIKDNQSLGSSNDSKEDVTNNAVQVDSDSTKSNTNTAGNISRNSESNPGVTTATTASNDTKQESPYQGNPQNEGNQISNSVSSEKLNDQSENTEQKSEQVNQQQKAQVTNSSNAGNNRDSNNLTNVKPATNNAEFGQSNDNSEQPTAPTDANKSADVQPNLVPITNLSVSKEVKPNDNNLQKVIEDARSKGIEVNVTNKTVTVLSNNLSDEEKKIQAHYADEIDYILATQSNYEAALKKANDDYEAALKDYKNTISKLPNPGGMDPNTIHNNISLPTQGNNNGSNVSVESLSDQWESWTGVKDINSDNGWQGGKANTPDWVVSLPGGWSGQGNKITVIAPKGGLNNPVLNNIGTIKIKLNKPGYYHDPVTGKNTTIAYLRTTINSISDREANHYKDGLGGHNINLLYAGDLGLTSSWHVDQINNTDQFLDENGNPIDFSHGGGYLNDENSRIQEKDTNGKVIDWANPNNPDTNHWWAGPKQWDNWTPNGGFTFYGSASKWGQGAKGHDYIGSSVYEHNDGWRYSDVTNMPIWNQGSPMNGSIASSDPNNPAYSQTTNHGNYGEYEASGAMLNGSSWTHSQKILDNAQNSFGNLGYQYDALIPPAQDIPPVPIKRKVEAPKINVDTTNINSVTPTPDKKVNDSTGQDTNGKNVIPGSILDYGIDWDLSGLENMNPSDVDVSKELSITDHYDKKTTALQNTLKVTDSKGRDITSEVSASWDPNNHVLVVSAKNAREFFKEFTGQKLNVKFSASVNDGVTGDVNNSANQNTFGNDSKTNVVINHIFIPAPSKEVHNQNGDNINGKTVARGDTLDYKINWDLSGLKDFNPSTGQVAKGLTITDNYDSKVSPDKGLVRLLDSKGNDITDQVSISWEDLNHSFTISAKNAQEFFNKYRGTKLTVDFPTTVMSNSNEDIVNQASQNTFGINNKTNMVVNHELQINPKKDVVIDAGSHDSLNGQEIKLNSHFDYELDASRPANYGGNTNEWSFIDIVPSQDHVTGQWQVYANSDITLSDGTVLHAGTDITKYFTFTLDRNTGKVVISANKDFLNIINADVNRKNEIKWNAYFQVKRIATGENITNIAEESYNHQIVKTNKVSTNTPEPATPAPNCPTPCPTPITPVLPNCPSPLPVKKTTPEQVQPSVKEAVKEAVQRNLSQQTAPSVKSTVQQVVSTMDKKQEVKNGVLPQTGQNENDSDKSIGILFLIAGILGSLGLFGHRKKEVN